MAFGTRNDSPKVASGWRVLASEGWTLVASYEYDGNHYRVVAIRNAGCLPRCDAALSPRESQVVECALVRDSNKVIAYELGISASTVGVLLHRAAQKLGCRNRAELLQRSRELASAASSPLEPSQRRPEERLQASL